jgi:hypothetical protein
MVVLNAGSVSATVPLSFPATCVSISPDGVTVAVGADDNKATVFHVHRNAPSNSNPLGTIRSAFSPWRAVVSSNLQSSLSATAPGSRALRFHLTVRFSQRPTATEICCCGTRRPCRLWPSSYLSSSSQSAPSTTTYYINSSSSSSSSSSNITHNSNTLL